MNMDDCGWIEIRLYEGRIAKPHIYVRKMNGHDLVVQQGFESGKWWAIVNNRPVGWVFMHLLEAMETCENMAREKS